MRFTARNVDQLSFRSGGVSGLNAAGSAAVAGGTLNTGSAQSDIVSELNPVVAVGDGKSTLTVAGNNTQLSRAFPLQGASLEGKQENRTIQIQRGNLDDNLKTILLQNPKLIEIVSKDNPADPTKPYTKVQFTEDYATIDALITSNTTKGTHILSTSTSTQAINHKTDGDPTKQTLAWSNGTATEANPQFSGYRNGEENMADNVVRVDSAGAVGTTGNTIQFSVVGFSTNPKPDEGKTSTIAAFATNNRTVGSIRVPDQIDGKKPTLEDIAAQYGTTVEQLVKVNNLPSSDIDITGINLTVPADLLSVDYYVVTPPVAGQTTETPRSVAKRFGISVSWLLDLNGWTDSEQPLSSGQRVQIPGLTKSCDSNPGLTNCRTNPLPPAKPLPAALESADYGAYTTTEVTYNCSGPLAAYCARFLRPLR